LTSVLFEKIEERLYILFSLFGYNSLYAKIYKKRGFNLEMINKEALIYSVLAVLLMGYVFSLEKITFSYFLLSSLMAIAILVVNFGAKKLSASLFDCNISLNLWTLKRFGFAKSRHFKNPLPMWVIFPLVLAWASAGVLQWIAVTVFDASPSHVALRRRYSEISEWELALIAVSGSFANILLALILQAFSLHEFAMFSALFAVLSLVPFGQLDGTKVFFGSRMLWIFSILLSLIVYILLGITNVTATIIAAVLIAVIGVVLYYIFREA